MVYNKLLMVCVSGAMVMPKGDPLRLVADYHAIHQQLETLLAGTRRTITMVRHRASQEETFNLASIPPPTAVVPELSNTAA